MLGSLNELIYVKEHSAWQMAGAQHVFIKVVTKDSPSEAESGTENVSLENNSSAGGDDGDNDGENP